MSAWRRAERGDADEIAAAQAAAQRAGLAVRSVAEQMTAATEAAVERMLGLSRSQEAMAEAFNEYDRALRHLLELLGERRR